MSNTSKIIIVLTVIALFSGGVLGVLDSYTRPIIEQHREESRKNALKEVLPQNDGIHKVEKEDSIFYVAYKGDNKIALAFEASGGGYQSNLALMVGVTMDFSEITGVKILEQLETPGLGTRIEDDPANRENRSWFMDQFKGLAARQGITYVKNAKPQKDTEIEAITGATVSSGSVVRILNQHIQKAAALWGEEIEAVTGASP